VSFVTKEVHVA